VRKTHRLALSTAVNCSLAVSLPVPFSQGKTLSLFRLFPNLANEEYQASTPHKNQVKMNSRGVGVGTFLCLSAEFLELGC